MYMHIMLLYTVASAPTDLTAVQEGLTSIRVSWSLSSDATGYIISYTGGGSSDSVTVSGGSTDNYLLTGLVMDASYSISIAAHSRHFSSHAVELQVTLGEALLILSKPNVISLCACSLSSRSAECDSDLYNSHLHLPLLECSQWLSGDQFRGDVERGQQWY